MAGDSIKYGIMPFWNAARFGIHGNDVLSGAVAAGISW